MRSNTFEQFLRGLPAGVQVFSLFEANPSLGRLIVDICMVSPALASYLGRNASVLDAVIGGDFFSKWPDSDGLVADLTTHLNEQSDYEGKLDAARRWQKEWHFRIGVHHLQNLSTPEEAGRQYAALAQACLQALLPVVSAQLETRHGPAPGRGAVVLGMGSLGAGKLTAQSDLDLIVVYDAQDVEQSDGARPLAVRAYFARLTQTLITALTAPTAEGKLYEVDMRLRPSGQSGPVATSLQAFQSYQMEEAWVWEHQALTRARALAGDASLQADVMAVCDTALRKDRRAQDVVRDTQEMRVRLSAQPPRDEWDVKAGPGGAQDIDLFGQAACLVVGDAERRLDDWLAAAVRLDWCSDVEAAQLAEARTLYWRVSQASKLISETSFDPERSGAGGVRVMMRDTVVDSLSELQLKLEKCRKKAIEVINRVMT